MHMLTLPGADERQSVWNKYLFPVVAIKFDFCNVVCYILAKQNQITRDDFPASTFLQNS